MTERRLYLDPGPGETRAVVTLDGRPERLLLAREGDFEIQALGARAVGRIRSLDRAAGLAFIDLGAGPDAVLNLVKAATPLAEGHAVEVEIRSEARRGKGASVRLIGLAEGPPRLVEAAPDIAARLAGFAPGAAIVSGPAARAAADEAQEEALATVFLLPGGGSAAIETTRALTAVDVDLGGRPGGEPKRATRAANLAALATAARVLRLKGLGGLVVFDLVGRGHDGAALLAVARAAFGPDNPGVAIGPVSRFGTLELTIPRRACPVIERLGDPHGGVSAETEAFALARALEREAEADGGGRFVGLAAPEVVEAARRPVALLNARLGGRLSLRAEPTRPRGAGEVARD
jgi:hypothetical protein